MEDVEEYVDANEIDNNLSLKFNLKLYFKEFWLAITTALVCLLAIVQSSFVPLNLNEDLGAHILLIPAHFFFRHVRSFVVLFVIFASANKTAMLFESKRSTVKVKILLHYFIISGITLVLTLCAGYLIIMRRNPTADTLFFSKYVDLNYRPFDNFIRFFRGLFVHDLPGNVLTTRLDHYNEFGTVKLSKGLGDGYNAPGFIIFGAIIAFSTYFLGKDGEILRNLIQLIHRSMLAIYWILLCYSPIALYFGGIVQFDIIRREKLYGFLIIRYMLLLTSVVFIALLQIFVILPCFHFVRTRKFGYDVIFRLSALFPSAFVEGSTVRMVERTKQYLKSRRFSSEAVDSYLNYCTLINGAGVVSGFAINAIFSLKLYSIDFDWAVVIKIIFTSMLMSVPATEFIQGYMFGIIFFLNSSMINPDFIMVILVADWLMDRVRVISNVVADALTIDYIESMNKTSTTSTQSL
ncbi:sodium transporter [Theileria orientalis strain Shintoku]|uniref:Amino acid transporter n=1 Tax=Theileria orientalis strain Shintoku TaxID=869250 RepID=J4DA94_THEOR|nr:sodium transporter [Theileria orientalis strain Shintoku]BAM41820.1 sodium transporter [Theileria orientalis strain Shintoku]|eukprot:XP_009692121.1 sodium transporter [Theileria orientalis strain Shintoku]